MTLSLDPTLGLHIPVARGPSRAASTSTRILAEILDRNADPGPSFQFSESLRGGARNLRELAATLSPDQRRHLEAQWGRRTLEEIYSLAQERDSRIFEAGLLTLHHRLRDEGRSFLGASLLQTALVISPSENFSSVFIARARREIDIVAGRGPLGAQLGHYAEGIFAGATDGVGLATFAVGAGFFQVGRMAALTRFMGSASPLLRGGIGEALAGLIGVTAEAGGMTLSAQGLSYLSGGPLTSDPELLAKQTLGLGFMLGLLRGGGFVTRSAFNRLHGIDALTLRATRLPAFTAISQRLLPQTAMFAGIALGHSFETYLGIRSETDRGTWLAESMATLFQFNLAGALFERVQPRALAQLNLTLQTHAEGFRSPPAPWLRLPDLSLGPWRNFALADGPRLPVLAGERIESFATSMMSAAVKVEGEGTVEGPNLPSITEMPPAPPPMRPISSIAAKMEPWRQMFEVMPTPVVVTDAEGWLRYVNPQAQDLLSGSSDAMLRGRMEDIFEAVPEEPGLFHLKNAESSPQFWEIVTREIENGEGHFHFITDRTREKNLEAENARLTAQHQFAQDLMHDASHMLTDVSLREQFLERMVRAAPPSTLPSGDAEAGPVSTRWEVVKGRVAEMGSALNKALTTFSNARRMMQTTPHHRALLMRPFLEEVLPLTEGLRENQGVRLHRHFLAEDLVIMGDEGSLSNSVMNLLINACHAMPNGGDLTVRTYRDGAMGVIEVSDTGVGIAPEHLPKIFDLGFTTKEREGGSGLGLHNVKNVVERVHHGRVEVESIQNVGTIFRLYLPLTRGSLASK